MSRISEQSLAHLAERDWVLLEDYFPEAQLQTLSKMAESLWHQGAFQAAKVGRSADQKLEASVRSDWTHWLDLKASENLELAVAIQHLQRELNQALYLGLQDFECHFARYSEGQFYARHIDQSPSKSSLHGERVISFVLYLNLNWQPGDGGELCLFHQDREMLIEPRWGRLMLFRSDTVPHAVMKSLKERWSLTGWFRRL
jgi:SM-20-related protein